MVATTGALFGLLGLVLAGMGLFGIAAFAVARRTSELGLRIALGAGRWDVIRESLRETTRVVAFGLVAGVVTALVMTRWLGSLISGLLFGLSPADWTTVVIAALLLVVGGGRRVSDAGLSRDPRRSARGASPRASPA